MNGALARTLPAMTAVQAMVAMGTFALSVLAPQLGVEVQALGWLGSVLFAVGALSSLAAGWCIRRFGDLQLAGLCMLAVLLAMLCLAIDAMALTPLIGSNATGWSLWPAVVLLGLAFGPETPASVSALARVTPLAKRPWVFSVRQTGNQIGAVVGSLSLPLLFLHDAAAPFWLVAALSLCVGVWCVRLTARTMVTATEVPSAGLPTTGTAPDATGLRELANSDPLKRLTVAVVVFMAAQVCLNFFVMSHAVRHWQLPPTAAAAWVAWMQAAGLVGRLLWGYVAQRPDVATGRLLGGLGLLMGAAGLPLFLWPGTPSAVVLAPLLGLLGLSASGWNGVMMAEVARISGAARAGAVAGAVLMFGYAGLALAPLCFAAMGGRFGTAATFAALTAAAGVMGLYLLLSSRPTPSYD